MRVVREGVKKIYTDNGFCRMVATNKAKEGQTMTNVTIYELEIELEPTENGLVDIADLGLLLGCLRDIYAIGAMSSSALSMALDNPELGAFGYHLVLDPGLQLKIARLEMDSPLVVKLVGLSKQGIAFLKRYLSVKMFVAALKGIFHEWDEISTKKEDALVTQIQVQNLASLLSISEREPLLSTARQADEYQVDLERRLANELLQFKIATIQAMKRDIIIQWEKRELLLARLKKDMAIKAGATPEEIAKLNQNIKRICLAFPSPAYAVRSLADPSGKISRDEITTNRSTLHLLADSSEESWGE